jgi:predicted dehydrogenase
MANGRVKIGIIGSQFEADIHAASIQMGCAGEVAAVASPTVGHPEALADRYGIPKVFHDYRELLKDPEIELVTIAAPNKLHCELTVAAANAGKHVVCEKPLCMTLEEADEMIDTCKRQGVQLFYAEELFFTPKYVKAKQMAEQGAFGDVYLVKQSEMHFGPHAEWFWDVEQSGGGVFMDMGCHGVAFCYWFLGRPKPVSVLAQMGTYVHGELTKGDDHSFCIVEFENGAVGHVEDSWARRGGMDDRIEIYGSEGVTYGNLHMGNALPTYSETGYGYAVEKAPGTSGWTYPVFEELWNYGFPQELEHFARCVRGQEEPIATGEDGRVAQELLVAGYQSAGTGRRVELPFRPDGVAKPIDLWFNPVEREAATR